MLAYVTQGIGYGLAAAAQPGPFQTYIISQTLNNGWRRTLPSALAPLISDGPIIALVLLVMSQVPDWLRQFLHIAGGLFTLYLAAGAFNAWRNDGAKDANELTTIQPGRQSVLRAAMMNMLNPAPYIYWSLVTGPILLTGWQEAPAHGLGFLIGFYGSIVASLAGIILVFGTARRLGPKVNRGLLGIAAIALTCFGLHQLWLGISAYLGR
jgi:threonine/homoserine/homoserine lactone efflux protein